MTSWVYKYIPLKCFLLFSLPQSGAFGLGFLCNLCCEGGLCYFLEAQSVLIGPLIPRGYFLSGLFSLCMDVLERIWSLSPVAPVKVRKDAFIWWSRQSSSWRSLFIISCWCLWTWRNVHIFQGSKEPLQVIIQQILACHESLHQKAYSPNVLASWFWVFFSCSGMLVPVLWISVSWQSDLLLFFPMCISVR